MEELKVFTNEEFGEIRIIEKDGEPWFIGKELVDNLGYIKGYSDVIKQQCEVDDYILVDRTRPLTGVEFDFREIGQRGGYIVNESGLYALIFGSKLESAKRFKHWVTSEVLPTIRKHGAYMTEQTIEKALTSPDFLIQLATQLKQEQEARKLAEQTIVEQKPLVDFATTVANSSDSIDMNEMAKLCKKEGIDIGRNRLFSIMRERKILMSNNNPYQKYIDNGYFEVIETTKTTPYGTKLFAKTLVKGKGQIKIVEMLRKLMLTNE